MPNLNIRSPKELFIFFFFFFFLRIRNMSKFLFGNYGEYYDTIRKKCPLISMIWILHYQILLLLIISFNAYTLLIFYLASRNVSVFMIILLFIFIICIKLQLKLIITINYKNNILPIRLLIIIRINNIMENIFFFYQ